MSTTKGQRGGRVVIPTGIKPYPKHHEITAAALLAEYFKTDVYVLERKASKTADFKINNSLWELKSPTGSGKHNVQHALRAALMQSQNIVFDSRYSKLHQNKIINELNRQISLLAKLKQLIFISKQNQILKLK